MNTFYSWKNAVKRANQLARETTRRQQVRPWQRGMWRVSEVDSA